MRKVKVVTWFLCLVLLFGMCPFPMQAEGAGSNALTLQSCTPSEAFTGGGFQISLGAADEGKLPLSLSVSLDSGAGDSPGFLPRHYERALDAGLIHGQDSTRDKYRDYLNGLSVDGIDEALPPIRLSCTFDGAYLDLPVSAEGELTVAGEIGKIGSYQWLEGTGGNLELTVILDRYVYSCLDVAFNERFEFQLKEGVRVEGGPPSLQLGEDKLITVLGLTDRADPTAQYRLTKAAPAEVDTPTFPYTITAELQPGAGGSLTGKVLRDRLPQGLTLAAAAVALDGGGPSALPESGYRLEDGVFTYQIPEKSAGESYKSVALALTLRLDAERYREFTAGELTEASYTNSAELLEDGETTALLTSNEATTQLKGKFFSKEGTQDKGNSRLFHWTITVDSYANAEVSAFLVDRINGDVLSLDGDVSITVDGVTKTLTNSSPVSGPAYGDIKNDSITEDGLGLGGGNPLPQDGATDTCYTYKEGSEGLLILPFSQYMGEKVEIKYDTLIHESLLQEPNEEGVQVQNDAKLVWNYFGEGVGPWAPEIGFTVDKTVNLLMAEKSAGQYHQTEPLPWNFRTNPGRGAIRDLVITDTVDADVMEYALDPAGILVYRLDEGVPASTPAFTLTTADNGGKYFTFSEDAEKKTQTLTVYLGDQDADEQYSFSLPTKLVGALSAAQGKNQSLSNTASVSGTVGGTQLNQNTTATAKITNVFVEKTNQLGDETASYSYEDKSVGWTVTANPNYESIDELVLTDRLPAGTTGTLLSLEKSSRDGTTLTGMPSPDGTKITFSDGKEAAIAELTDEETKDGYLANRLVLNFGDTADKYVLRLKTLFTDDKYRADKLDTGEMLSAVNHVALAGTVNGHPLKDAEAGAAHALTLPALEKRGAYHRDENYPKLGASLDYITWSVVVNKNKTNLAGRTVTDLLPDHMELDPDSLTLYEAVVKADGQGYEKGRSLSSADSFGLDADSAGFSLTVPESYDTTPFLIEFNTLLVQEAAAGQMKNQVTLAYGDQKIGTGQQQAESSHNFDEAAFRRATVLPNLTIRKLSANTGDGDFPLSGAVFELQQVEWDDANPGWKTVGTPKVKTTGADGKAFFLFLKKDAVYRLVEREAPAGYAKDDAPRYFSITAQGTEGSYEDHGAVIHTGAEDGRSFSHDVENELQTAVPPEGGPPVAGGTLSFLKRSEGGAPLVGVTFTLSAPGLQDRQTRSDSAGLVTFQNLDPNVTYTLTETTPQGYQPPAGPLTARVTYSEGAFHTVLKLGDREAELEDGAYVLKNHPIRGTVTLEKRDAVSGAPLSGAEFTVYEGNAPVALLVESGQAGSYVLAPLPEPARNPLGEPFVSDGGGLLWGSYTLAETRTPAGYLPDADGQDLKRHGFKIETQGQQVAVTNAAGGFVNSPCGTVVGTKTDTAGRPLAGALLGLFPQDADQFTQGTALKTAVSGNDGKFTFSQVPYGSYLVAELQPPSGYYLNQEDRLSVTVSQNTSSITLDAAGAPLTLENARIPYVPSVGTLALEKTSEDGRREGFSFRITDGKRYDRTFRTDGEGRILVQDLPAGTYKVTEVEDEAVRGIYVPPEPQSAVVTTQGVKLSFYNRLAPAESPAPSESGSPTVSPSVSPEVSPSPSGSPAPSVSPRPSSTPAPGPGGGSGESNGPHTGYDSHTGLWTAVLLLSLAGLAASLALLYKTRRRGRRER